MRAREREGERIALVSARLRLRQQQSIDLLFIIVHYSPLCTVYLSLSLACARAFFPLFCCQQRLRLSLSPFVYTCHCAMFRARLHTCRHDQVTDANRSE